MQLVLRRLAIVGTFLIWVFPRIFPSLIYAGVYSFDSWYFLGHSWSILEIGRIPPFDPFKYPYFFHPSLYFITIHLSNFLGISLIDSYRTFAVILIITGFLIYFSLFRKLLGQGWSSIIGLLVFSVAVDVIAQTNCVIQENMALIFLGLLLWVSISLIFNDDKEKSLSILLILLVPTLVLTHHLTTYFAILLALSILIASLLLKNGISCKRGAIIGFSLTASLLSLLLFLNPIVGRLLSRYTFFLTIAIIGLILICSGIYFGKNKIWELLEKLRKRQFHVPFILLGLVIASGFFIAVLAFYPYGRTWQWVAIKFGFFTILLGLSISITRLLPWYSGQKQFMGLFVLIAILIMGVSFAYSGLFTIIYSGIVLSSTEVALGHRHFTFLLIPLAVASAIVIRKIQLNFEKKRHTRHRIIFPSIILLILIASSTNIYNLYYPIGGWYPEGCDNLEINMGKWLVTYTNFQSTVSTDRRLIQMMYGLSPIDSGQFNLVWLNPVFLENPRLILEELITHREGVYFLTSDLAEINFIIEFLQPPISLDISTKLSQATSVSRIFASYKTSIYWLLLDE